MFEQLPTPPMALEDAIAHLEARLAELDEAIENMDADKEDMEAFREAVRTAIEFMTACLSADTVRYDEDDLK